MNSSLIFNELPLTEYIIYLTISSYNKLLHLTISNINKGVSAQLCFNV